MIPSKPSSSRESSAMDNDLKEVQNILGALVNTLRMWMEHSRTSESGNGQISEHYMKLQIL